MTEHPSGCRDTLHVHRGFRAPGSLIHELSRVSASCVCCAGRCWTVLKSRGRDARLVAPGAPRSEGRRWRGFQPSTGAAALNATPPPMTRPRPSRSAPNPRWRCKPSSMTRPRHPRVPRPSPAPRMALLWCRDGALRGPGVQNGGDQPGHHAARHRKHTEKTAKTQRKRQAIAWFPGDTQASEALIPSVLDTPGPTTQSTDPTNNPPGLGSRTNQGRGTGCRTRSSRSRAVKRQYLHDHRHPAGVWPGQSPNDSRHLPIAA